MKRATGLMIFIFMLSLSIYSQPDMHKYLNDTRILQREGKYQEALERHIWFYEHALEYAPSMIGVRNSFALSDWKNLGNVYPPAMDSLKETRDKKMEKILTNQFLTIQSSGNDQQIGMLFQDLAAINRELGEDSLTVSFFQSLILLNPETARKCWNVAKETMFKEKQYEIINIYIQNPLNEYLVIKNQYDLNLGYYSNEKAGGIHFKSYNERRFVEQCIRLIQLSYYNNDEKSANEIHKLAKSIINDDLLKEALDAELNKQSGDTFLELYRQKARNDEMADRAAKKKAQLDSLINIEKMR